MAHVDLDRLNSGQARSVSSCSIFEQRTQLYIYNVISSSMGLVRVILIFQNYQIAVRLWLETQIDFYGT